MAEYSNAFSSAFDAEEAVPPAYLPPCQEVFLQSDQTTVHNLVMEVCKDGSD